jgi:adhesin transport system outer membrane protein
LAKATTVNAVVAAPPKTPDVLAREESLAAFVKDWAAGWSSGNAERYLSFYSERFVPETKINFSTWAEQRRQRITPEQGIQVQIEDTQVLSSSPQLAELSFKQFYVSKSLKARSTKQLTLEQHNGQWAIVRERVIPK